MKIGFDISQTGAGKAGCGFFADALVRRLIAQSGENELVLLPAFGDFYFDPLVPLLSSYVGASLSYGPRFLSRSASAVFWSDPQSEKTLGLDLIHANNYWCPTSFGTTRIVYTLYDLGFTVDPNWTTEANRVGCFDGVFRAAASADWIVAISQNSALEFLAMFPHFPEERMQVIYPCSRFDDDGTRGQPPAALAGITPSRFWLSVGTIEPRKNQKMLLQAYADYLAAGGDPMPLVLAGGKGWLMDDLAEFIGRLGIAENVILTGYVSDAELVWLYRNCFANLYPSLYEGFGLPVLEGMQFGAAVLASNTSSLPEVVGSAGIQLDPRNQKEWMTAMLNVASGSINVDNLREAAIQRASQFNWSSSTEALLDVYATAISKPKRSHRS